MEFGFTEEQERLRKEIREFFMKEVPEDYGESGGSLSTEAHSFSMELQRKAGERGFLTPGWSKESGGLGLSPIEQGIIEAETSYAGMMWPSFVGLHQLGPGLHLFGTEEQKRKFLPGIARGEMIWMQLFTEPEAGSDEANIQMRAVQNGDDFILNGQKIFISGGHKPDYLYTLARTADTIPKHRGISLFLIPADTPGITFRPLPGMGFSMQNEVFFDDVRVSKKCLLGELNRGFYHAMSTFQFERGGTGFPAGVRKTLEELIQFYREEKRNGKPLIKDPEVRKVLARMAVELEVWRLTTWKAVWWFSQRERLGPPPYDLSGFFWKIFSVRQAEAMMNIMGLYGQLGRGSKWAKFAGRLQRSWQGSRSTHGGGTFEIYKIVLAERGLGLPRAPRAEVKRQAKVS